MKLIPCGRRNGIKQKPQLGGGVGLRSLHSKIIRVGGERSWSNGF